MRYQNWDILLFPEGSKVPLQEFRTGCWVVQDQEFYDTEFGLVLVPTVTTFIPGLKAGTPFRVSIHCWESPGPSKWLQELTTQWDDVVLEARVFIDGVMSGATRFGQQEHWPVIINRSMVLDKNGYPQRLGFPDFNATVLTESHWNAGDELGRIRIVISEGFIETGTDRFERLRNMVAFAYQHAPLEALEKSAIAWPNVSMWYGGSSRSTSIAPPSPVRRGPSEVLNPQAHSHSPRKSAAHSSASTTLTSPTLTDDHDVHGTEQDAPIKMRRLSSDYSMADVSSLAPSDTSESNRHPTPFNLPSHGCPSHMLGAQDFVPTASASLIAVDLQHTMENLIEKSARTTTPLGSPNKSRQDTYQSQVFEEPTIITPQPHKFMESQHSSDRNKRQKPNTPENFLDVDHENEPRNSHASSKRSHRFTHTPASVTRLVFNEVHNNHNHAS